MLPDTIIPISRTENVQQLAELYSAADAFINPTWQDNYPTVNLEAISCGTPVVTYRTGGSVEAVTDQTGLVVEQGDVEGLLQAARKLRKEGKDAYNEDQCNCNQRHSTYRHSLEATNEHSQHFIHDI